MVILGLSLVAKTLGLFSSDLGLVVPGDLALVVVWEEVAGRGLLRGDGGQKGVLVSRWCQLVSALSGGEWCRVVSEQGKRYGGTAV